MNIKSYIKGIGVGVIVTALILIIAGNMNKGMSDADVIKRAKELGMVEAAAVSDTKTNDNETVNVDDKTDKNENTVTNSDEKTDENVNVMPDSNDNAIVDSDDKASVIDNDVTDSDDIQNQTNADEDNSNSVEETTPEENSVSTDEGETVKVEVKSGMSSESVSLAVKNAGLVENDSEFNKYLCENGYDKRLRVGSFDIPAGSDFETISKYLCGIN